MLYKCEKNIKCFSNIKPAVAESLKSITTFSTHILFYMGK